MKRVLQELPSLDGGGIAKLLMSIIRKWNMTRFILIS